MKIQKRFTEVSGERYDRVLIKRFIVFLHTDKGDCKMIECKDGKHANALYRLGLNSSKIYSGTIEFSTQTRSYIVKRTTTFSRYSPPRKELSIYDCNAGKHIIHSSKRPG
jgi:hypothetical protein